MNTSEEYEQGWNNCLRYYMGFDPGFKLSAARQFRQLEDECIALRQENEYLRTRGALRFQEGGDD